MSSQPPGREPELRPKPLPRAQNQLASYDGEPLTTRPGQTGLFQKGADGLRLTDSLVDALGERFIPAGMAVDIRIGTLAEAIHKGDMDGGLAILAILARKLGLKDAEITELVTPPHDLPESAPIVEDLLAAEPVDANGIPPSMAAVIGEYRRLESRMAVLENSLSAFFVPKVKMFAQDGQVGAAKALARQNPSPVTAAYCMDAVRQANLKLDPPFQVGDSVMVVGQQNYAGLTGTVMPTGPDDKERDGLVLVHFGGALSGRFPAEDLALTD